jgi:cyanophycinase
MTHPTGKLIAVGGAEDKGTDLEKGEIHRNNLNFFELAILRRIAEEAGGVEARIEVITTASIIPNEVGTNYLNGFGKIGCTNVGLMHIRNRKEAQQDEYLMRIRQCDAVMFSGGNQMRLSAAYLKTEFLEVLHHRYNFEKFLIAGTSAGAMAMSKTMIYDGNSTRAHLKGEVKMTEGLGFISKVIIDSHFEKRGRFGRLAQAVATHPSCIGIGLGEDTGMLITEGNQMEAIGSGLVIIIDGHDIKHSNVDAVKEGSPLSVENLKVHFCEKGNGYLLKERKYLMKVKGKEPVKSN